MSENHVNDKAFHRNSTALLLSLNIITQTSKVVYMTKISSNVIKINLLQSLIICDVNQISFILILSR